MLATIGLRKNFFRKQLPTSMLLLFVYIMCTPKPEQFAILYYAACFYICRYAAWTIDQQHGIFTYGAIIAVTEPEQKCDKDTLRTHGWMDGWMDG